VSAADFEPVNYELQCYGCGLIFYWTAFTEDDVPPSFHNTNCKKRKNRRIADNPVFNCPRPDKEVFWTSEAANERARSLSKPGEFVRPYRCSCGELHVGHINYEIVDEIPAGSLVVN
jgi:hypothetical protein